MPLALLALLFVVSLVVRAPDGGLAVAPLGIAERAAAGLAEAPDQDALRFGAPLQVALAN